MTERLKADNPLEWVQRMNNIRNAVEEDMTQQEIGLFCKEIGKIVQIKGINDGFAAAQILCW